jgi:ectoine hydroxylase-related dioxygenase (phytanoyl-CoA dioxygenase family)
MDTTRRGQLLEDGYCLVPGVLDVGMLGRLRAATDLMLDAQTEEHKARTRSQGSMFGFPQTTDPVFAELIALPAALAALARLGFTEVTFTDAYIISKPPHSPQLFWHYDWFAWEEPEMYLPAPPQVFLMYYLTDTCRANGCLRVIPGSHTRRNPLHDLIAEPHSATLGRAEDLERAEFGRRPDEIDVPVRAGELVIGDARLLHAAHPNGSDRRRTVLTLWYQPDYRSLPERVKAQMVAKTQPLAEAWPAEDKALVSALHPVYHGAAPPHARMLRPKQSPATASPPPLPAPRGSSLPRR